MDFKQARTVLVGRDLYAFKFGSPVSAFKYADFIRIERLVKTTLSTLHRSSHLGYFSVSYMKGTFVLTGG